MKTMKTCLVLGVIFLMSFSFTGCTHDDPAPGPQGIAGLDGTDGVDGVDGTASCVACHSESHRDPIERSYLYSSHYDQTIMYNGMTLVEYTTQSFFGGSCVQCHTNEGYIDYTTTGMVFPGEYANATAISCTTCHDSHSTFDFENDGHDYALRSFEPVTLITDSNYTIDLGDKSNNCISCHQPRTAPPIGDGSGMFTVTSSHWGPHHGPQSTLLEGIQGAELTGAITYPGIGTAPHRTGSSCTSCHMGAASAISTGAHSFSPTSTACISCHPNGAPSQVEGLTADMEALAALLEAVGIVHEGHPVEGTYTIEQASAAWNYLLIVEDSSNGIHNPAYSSALIKNSIENL